MIKSFRYAFNGIRALIVRERNARIHFVIFGGVVAAGFFFCLTATEWVAIIIVSGVVLAAEAVNTSIEILANTVSPEFNPNIKLVKDIAAGGVLLAAIAAAATGAIVFVPKIVQMFL